MPPKKEYKSIMPAELHGVCYISGLRGVGKSTLAAQAERPELTVFWDFDDGKGRALHEQLRFGLYRDVMAEMVKEYGRVYNPKQVYAHLNKMIDELPQDTFNHIILDNIDYIEQGLTVEVKRDPDSYGISRNKAGISNAMTGAFGGAYPGVNQLVSGLVNVLHARGVKLVTAVAHVKAVWGAGGQVPNKHRPRGVERWQQMSVLSMIVIPGTPNPLPPAALIQKEALGKISFNADKNVFEKPQRRLPLRLPEATFAAIYKYLKSPADLRNPQAGEVPTLEEQQPFSDKFSKEQLNYMMLAAQLELKEEKQGDSFAPSESQLETVKAMLDEGKSPKEVQRETGVKVSDMAKAGLLE